MFSIIVPFYNESKNIKLVLEEFKKFQGKYDFELICVNDGSKDDTETVLNEHKNSGHYPFMEFISYYPNGGYGNAIMTGVRTAKGEVIAWTHSDMQTPVSDVFKAYDYYCSLATSYPLQATRFLIKGWRVNRTLQQVILSFGMAIIASVILRRKLTEINAQPKLFPRSMVDLLKNAPKDFSLDLYLLCIAQNNNYKIKTIDVSFKNRIHGESSWASDWRTKHKTILRSIKYICKLRKEV
ncbi:MAG: glycosyltransferase family 2 protein [Candidatus Doudnabacteria bacterium]|nr:glycosyltransferase family 2 protein [Candidatus Doudnabacteria bacterium]